MPTTKEEFVDKQLVFLNYLNILIACSRFKESYSPLIEMFFDKNGNIPIEYNKWLDERFLINGRENLSVRILDGMIAKNDKRLSYYKCSDDCDLFYSI